MIWPASIVEHAPTLRERYRAGDWLSIIRIVIDPDAYCRPCTMANLSPAGVVAVGCRCAETAKWCGVPDCPADPEEP